VVFSAGGDGGRKSPEHRDGLYEVACRERPRCRAAEQRDELAPFHNR